MDGTPSPTIWDGWTAPTGKDENSKIAAEMIEGRGSEIRRRVIRFIAAVGPVAEWEVSLALGLGRPTTTPRIWELHRNGVITRHAVKGRTPAGRPCWRYTVTPFWASYLEQLDT